ncbi:uncharacterized protein LOC131948938 [Physella acuta]|uniref:uncharacterized protein LOC131948938 n=1 Tax=Physella acuta TaxID=109671 RepID=UPI0027DE5093|nr:uncharacterized protein LOC131948938 [Physella acuta]XP_059166650.1 uncharacterized protein LOC131948938 [Physella acuta]XP_059166651.1 uncharacterized protein LOC131948938 [Physella acuta]
MRPQFRSNRFKGEHLRTNLFSNKSKNICQRKTQNTNQISFCKKNCRNNHRGFIPIREFAIDHLPPRYQNKAVYRNIRRLANLTTRIVVNEFRNSKRLGTGTVTGVRFVYDWKDDIKFAWVEITTAYHVVPSQRSALHTRAELFYDDNLSRRNVEYLNGSHIVSSNPEEDWCILATYTTDPRLAFELAEQLKEFEKQSRRVNRMFSGMSDLAIIVSHPHGGPKHVSIGKLSLEEPEKIVFIGNGFAITAVVNGDTTVYTLHFKLKDIVRGKYAEEVGIECEIWFPDETTSLYPLWQMDRLVRHTKHELFMQGGLRNFREDDMYMELELPEGQRQVMDDTKSLDYYKDDLSQAFRIFLKQKPLDFGNSVAFKTNRASPVC